MKTGISRTLYVSLGAVVVSAAAAVCIILLWFPQGPVKSRGLAGRYYNMVYSDTPCPAGQLRSFADDNVQFSYYSVDDSPHRESSRAYDGEETKLKGGSDLKVYVITAGNLFIDMYSESGKVRLDAATMRKLAFKYAEQNIGLGAKFEDDILPGARFSVAFSKGVREGLCFSGKMRNMYCLSDPDMPMQAGELPLAPFLQYSLGLGPGDSRLAVYGIGYWFKRPELEKISECNYLEIKRTLQISNGATVDNHRKKIKK